MNRYVLTKVVSHVAYATMWFLFVVIIANLTGLGGLQTGSIIENDLMTIVGTTTIVSGWIYLGTKVKMFIKNKPTSYRCALNPFC